MVAMSEAVNFEQSINRLEEIVQKLESGKLSLEESIQLYSEGTKLSQDCKTALSQAKLTVTEIGDKGEDE
jgi:exodeoxyribonuclease VII small subunit